MSVLACALLCSAVGACGGGSLGNDGGSSIDAGAATDAGATADGGGRDGGGRDGGVTRADGGSAGSGIDCTFNSDCPQDERCECEEASGCFCFTGVRGPGQSGVDPCASGNDCLTALCVEGDGGFFCSGPCTTDRQCGPKLPRCANIAFIGQICIR